MQIRRFVCVEVKRTRCVQSSGAAEAPNREDTTDQSAAQHNAYHKRARHTHTHAGRIRAMNDAQVRSACVCKVCVRKRVGTVTMRTAEQSGAERSAMKRDRQEREECVKFLNAIKKASASASACVRGNIPPARGVPRRSGTAANVHVRVQSVSRCCGCVRVWCCV